MHFITKILCIHNENKKPKKVSINQQKRSRSREKTVKKRGVKEVEEGYSEKGAKQSSVAGGGGGTN